jgi:hypothetical protein
MRIKFITREPRKGEAILLTDEGQEVERIPCFAHTATGKLGAIRHFEDVLLKRGMRADELKFKFTEVKE